MSASADVPDSVLGFAHGDRVAAVQLRRALEALRDHVDDPAVRRMAGQVLDGSRSMREVTREPGFLAALGRGMDRFASEWAAMSPEQRTALAAQGRRDTEELASDLGLHHEPVEVGDFGPARTEPGRD